MPAITDDGLGLPLAKKQKRTVDKGAQKKPQALGSRIFAPFRTLGLVSPTSTPFTYVRLGKSTFQVTTSVGRSLQTYDLRRGLNLVFASRPQTPEIITASFAWQDKVFAAWGNLQPGAPGGIWVFKRGKKVGSLELPPGLDEPVERLLVFGTWIVGCCSRSIQVWETGSHQHRTTLSSQHADASLGEPVYTGQICNAPTYLNKIFVGKYDGSVEIWNLRTGSLLYTILPPSSNAGPVTAIQPTPVLSLIAVAHKSGTLSIQNIETDQIVLSLRPASPKSPPITSISFRSDGIGAGDDGRKSGVMATASVESGDVTLWDLNNGGRVKGILRGAHRISSDETASGINQIEFLDGQPIMVSSGKDNSLKTWIFDETPFSPIPRPLHSRSGHSAAVSALTFLPAASGGSEFEGKWVLSASKDSSLWGFSLRKDSQNQELSQGRVEHTAKKTGGFIKGDTSARTGDQLKAPEITCIACSLNRDGGMGVTTGGPIWSNPTTTSTDASSATGWESIVTGHRGDKFARTWFWGKRKAGRWTFETGDGTEIKSVSVSQCGTFALVGSAGGRIEMFNLQSGLHQQSFPSSSGALGTKTNPRATGSSASRIDRGGHTRAVTGLMVDGLNRAVISCGLDGKVKFWDFMSGKLVDELNWHPMTAVTGLRYSSTSELVAFSCDDLSIRVVDIETRKLVREFWGCVGQVNDFVFSTDGRWVIAASMDSLIRIWDLPTGHLIDVFRVPDTCTALSMSSTGEFLATAHADGMQVNLWSNRSLFMPVSTKNVDESTVADISTPSMSGENGTAPVESAFSQEIEQSEEGDGPAVITEQLGKDMMTLSTVPRSRWQTLLHLDLVKERNKPKEPPKAPEKAPFFLPSVSEHNRTTSGVGSEGIMGQDGVDQSLLPERTAAERSRITKLQDAGHLEGGESRSTALLQSGQRSGDFEAFIEYLKSLTPAKADLEIRSLNPRVQDGHSELSTFVTALTSRLALKKDFELVNAWMAVFLKIHADTVVRCSGQPADEYSSLREALVLWSKQQEQESKRLSGLVGYSRGVAGFLRSAR